MQVHIIIDSTANLPAHLAGTLPAVPLTVRFGSQEYLDGVTISHTEFYEKLEASSEMPTTSQAAPAAFQAEFEKIAAKGDSAVVITLSSQFSGTYQSACIAAADYDHIYVVDSGSASIGTGLLVQRAVEMAAAGMDAPAIVQALEADKQALCIVACVDTLTYLQRGGRLSKTAAFAGGLLNIKPVLTVIAGKIAPVAKARGAKQAGAALMHHIEALGGIDREKPVLLGYTGTAPDALHRFLGEHGAALPQADFCCIGSVIGTHAGPGTVAVAFFKK